MTCHSKIMKVKELIWVETDIYIGTLPGLIGHYEIIGNDECLAVSPSGETVGIYETLGDAQIACDEHFCNYLTQFYDKTTSQTIR